MLICQFILQFKLKEKWMDEHQYRPLLQFPSLNENLHMRRYWTSDKVSAT